MKKLYIKPTATTYIVSTQGLMDLSNTEREGRDGDSLNIGGPNEDIGAKDFGGYSVWED